jgi:RsiW-degrading membrane proteinase PrsW (M82 family)
LNHLTPNGVLHLSVFVHFYETFLGILPSITLLWYFFHLKPHPKSDSTSVLGGCRILPMVFETASLRSSNLPDFVTDSDNPTPDRLLPAHFLTIFLVVLTFL